MGILHFTRSELAKAEESVSSLVGHGYLRRSQAAGPGEVVLRIDGEHVTVEWKPLVWDSRMFRALLNFDRGGDFAVALCLSRALRALSAAFPNRLAARLALSDLTGYPMIWEQGDPDRGEEAEKSRSLSNEGRKAANSTAV